MKSFQSRKHPGPNKNKDKRRVSKNFQSSKKQSTLKSNNISEDGNNSRDKLSNSKEKARIRKPYNEKQLSQNSKDGRKQNENSKAMVVDTSITSTEGQKLRGTKRNHKEETSELAKKAKLEELTTKERRTLRKKSDNNHFELALKAKVIWNRLREINLPVEKRRALSAELFSLIKGKTNQLVYAHDTSRVVQCLMKYGMPEHRNELFEELKGDVVRLSMSKYAKYFVRKLFKYGTKEQRSHAMKQFHGHVLKLLKHKEAFEVIEYAYNEYADKHQRAALVEEFYGSSFALFKSEEVRVLKDILTKEPEKRDSIVKNIHDSLSALSERNVLEHSTLVHKIFLDYFMVASDKLRSEMIESIREDVIRMVHTHDGSRVAMKCLWYGTAKDRKVILKSFKSFVTKICKEEFGHLVMLSLFDVVDDTKLVQKAILDEFLVNIDAIANDQNGVKVVLYLLSPRNPQHFCPDIVRLLEEGDNNPTSKKDSSMRHSELLAHVSTPLLQFVTDNCQKLTDSNKGLLLLEATIKYAKGDPSLAMRALASLAASPYAAGSSGHIIEQAAFHMTFKRLIANDNELIKEGKNVLFSTILLSALPEGSLRSWTACNRGCFTIVQLLDLDIPDVRARVHLELSTAKSSLKKLSFPGAQILLQKLKALE